jgi:metallo-beta-lactamase class B
MKRQRVMKAFALLLFLPVCLFGQARSSVQLSKIDDSVWVHTTYKLFNTVNLPSNGLIIQTSDGLVLIDTPWDDSLTVELLDFVKKQFNQDVVIAIITHAHVDRIGGIRTLHKKGIKVVSIALTCHKAEELGFEVPEPVFSTDTTFIFGNEQIEYFYPGAGHTVDNSVVWLAKRKILFGGCLVKAESSTNLGNVADADLKEWPRSIHKLMDKFPTAGVVVPGHGTSGGMELLQHTLDLLSVK